MTAHDILDLIAARHTDDLFVPECKDGPTWGGGGHLRMDAWAMNRSWARPLVTAYEIKVSRSDFLQDKKWQYYLTCCNEFFFACPHGLIQPTELPPEVGLLWVSQTGARLFVKKKAQFREPEIPECLWRYILMSRVTIKQGGFFYDVSKKEQWQEWLKQKEEDRDFGHVLSRTLRKTIEERISKVERENDRLQDRIKEFENIKEIIAKFGISPSAPCAWTIERKLKELQKVIPPDFERSVESLSRSLDDMKRELKKLTEEQQQQQQKAAA